MLSQRLTEKDLQAYERQWGMEQDRPLLEEIRACWQEKSMLEQKIRYLKRIVADSSEKYHGDYLLKMSCIDLLTLRERAYFNK